MAAPFLGEIRIVSFNVVPKGWALCNGQLMSIAQYQALFSLLGTTYGGDGITTFALPNLQGKTPIHFGGNYPQGSTGGEATHTLITSEMPAHTHAVQGSSADANTTSPVGNVWAPVPASASINAYNTTVSGTMNTGVVGIGGGGQPHDNMQPYLVLNVIIALQGIFPSRN